MVSVFPSCSEPAMNASHPFWTPTLACACALVSSVHAQVPARVPAPLAAPAASAPPVVSKSRPRTMTPAELRDSATVPGDVRPEDPVVPQVRIPLGRTPPVPAHTPAQTRRHDQAAAMGGVDDAVARCKAAEAPAARDACLARVRAGGGKAPAP
jgi:hypothetical protein